MEGRQLDHYLQPVHTPSAGFVIARITFQHLDHQPFATIFDALLQERLNIFHSFTVGRFRKVELAINSFEMFLEKPSSLSEIFLEQRLVLIIGTNDSIKIVQWRCYQKAYSPLRSSTRDQTQTSKHEQ
jgi:hypothetical protein